MKMDAMQDRTILHVDMNNFYASVECILNPKLLGKAIAVCGSAKERHGIVLAKSEPAKACGVKTAEAIWQAKKKCRDLIVVPPHYQHYIKYSRRAHQIYERYTDKIEPFGMDECWLDVSKSRRLGSGYQIAEKIRKEIKRELGITVSAGVSFNKVFAKLGSDIKKPDAVTGITRMDFRQKIWGLPACNLLNVGYATNKELKNYGIHTIGDLANASDQLLKKCFGKNGIIIKQYANGEDGSPVMDGTYVSPVKSVGHGSTTLRDLENSEEVWQLIMDLVQDIAYKLRLYRKRAGGISIAVRDKDLRTQEWQYKLRIPTQSTLYIAREAFALFQKSYSWEKPIRSLSVRAIYLLPDSETVQYDFFNSREHREKQDKMDRVIDEIRARFGKDAITSAILLQNHDIIGEERDIGELFKGMVFKGSGGRGL